MPWYYGILQASLSGTILASIAFICTRYLYKYMHKSTLVWLWIMTAIRYLCIFALPLKKAVSLSLPTIPLPMEGYVFLIGAVLIYYYNSYRQQIYHIRKLRNCTDNTTIELFEEIRQEYESDNAILREEYSNDAPYTIGFLNPKIIVSLDRVSHADLPFVLRHELCHIKSYDCLKNLLFIAVRIIHFFNPFVYLLLPYAREALELSCDEAVVGSDKVDRKEYGNSLLNQASMNYHNIPMTTNYVPHSNALSLRINALVNEVNKQGRAFSKIIALSFCVLAIVSLYFQTYSAKGIEEIDIPSTGNMVDEVEKEPVITTAPPITTTPKTTTAPITTAVPQTTTSPVTTTPKVTSTGPWIDETELLFSLSQGSISSNVFENYVDVVIEATTAMEYSIEYIKVHYYNVSNVEIGDPTIAYEKKEDAVFRMGKAWNNIVVFYSNDGVKDIQFEIGYYNHATQKSKIYYSEYINYLYAIDTYTVQNSFTYKNEYFRMNLEDEEERRNKDTIYFHVYFNATSNKESRVTEFTVQYYREEELIDTYVMDMVKAFEENSNLSRSNGWGTSINIPRNAEATHVQFIMGYVDGITGEQFTGSDNIKHPYKELLDIFGKS